MDGAVGRAGRAVATPTAADLERARAAVAAQLGVKATIVVPETASTAKLQALHRLRTELVCYGQSYDDAERHALELGDDVACVLDRRSGG